MHRARHAWLYVVIACTCAPLLWARSSSPTQAASGAQSSPDFSIQRGLIADADAARKAGDYATARAILAEVVASLLARPAAEQDGAWLELLNTAGRAAWHAQDLRTANGAWKRLYELRARTLPDDHPDLQNARNDLANTLYRQGDLAGARALQEKVLEVRSRALPDDHPDLQMARANLALTLYTQGDLAVARALQEKVLDVESRALPDDHPDLQKARLNLALTLHTQGDLAGARALREKLFEVESRTLPDEHPDLQLARMSLASTLYTQGDSAGARALYEQVLEVESRTLPDDHPDLQRVRLNLANTLYTQGDFASARALYQKVLEVRSRALPDDHPDLQLARANLAGTLNTQGDLAGARALYEKVFEVESRTLSDDHPDLQMARLNLANTLYMQGDLAGARALQEKVLEVRSRALPDDHPDMQKVRMNFASTLYTQGDLAGARTLYEKVLEVRSRTLSDDHPDLQKARLNLAITLYTQGNLADARALQEKVFEVDSRTLPDDHPDLQKARTNLASTLYTQGDLAGARALYVKVLEVDSRTLSDDHPDLQAARLNGAATIAAQLAREVGSSGVEGERTKEREEGRKRCAELIGALCRAQVHAARAAILGSPGREAEERCANFSESLGKCLSFAQGYGVFAPIVELEAPSFMFAETTRGAALASAELAHRAVHSPRYAELREMLRAASDALADVAQKGTTSEEFDRARAKREAAERGLVALAGELPSRQERGTELDVKSLATRLSGDEAAVSFRRFKKSRIEVGDELDSTGQPALREISTDNLCAFVVRVSKAGSDAESKGGANAAVRGDAQHPTAPTALLSLVDLGPIAPIEEATRAWREGLGVASASRGVGASAHAAPSSIVQASGVVLREKLLDPLSAALAGAHRIIVVLDDVLHLVPLDALPLDELSLVGDRFEIQTRTTLTELLFSPEPLEEPSNLVAFGDVDYQFASVAGAESKPRASDATTLAAIEPRPRAPEPDARAAATTANASGGAVQQSEATARAREGVAILRGGSWEQGFSALPGTGAEVRGIARSFTDRFGDLGAPMLCEHASATRERLLELAPKARFLHIATHGWFAPESVKSWSDAEPLDKQTGLGSRMSGEEQVKGMSPMLLCGLALAGANLPENEVGRAPGLVTADELSTLDLSNCELAVLSACDTNVGERRAGQGVASLQKALQMAGARSVITSLWKVPDEATKELMLDFYRRLWVEKKPKHQALWEAKKKLREAKDERGEPKYTTRDWAAWVLTGDPN